LRLVIVHFDVPPNNEAILVNVPSQRTSTNEQPAWPE
jgi:hypothetical protein